jgi:D-alanyl-lipoteichoic acid acyltransferase DltB (MBOAT superfamily)
MLFHNPSFLLLFLPTVLIFYFFLFKNSSKFRTLLLIISGFLFYAAWNIKLSPLIVITIIVNYYFSKKIILSLDTKSKKKFLVLSICFNIFFLFFFKYADFFIFNINFIFNSDIKMLNLPFPLALSFVTFQSIAYLVDCYEGSILETNLKKYSLFIIFFPQLIAGPIVRYNYMINQFYSDKNFSINYKNITIGFIIIAIGLVKKILIADNLSIISDQVFSSDANLSSLEVWIGSLSFTFQIYFDFSAYIDMATGIALLFNINLPQNFNSPYKATGIIDFWQRWHITLTFFLTNYLYNPLLKSLKNLTFFKSMICTLFVFLIAGLWHGPSWLFVIFGAMHGLGLVVNQTFKKTSSFKLNKIFSQFLTFIYINISFIFFRSENIESAIRLIKQIFLFDFKNLITLNNISLSTNSIISLVVSFLICFIFINTYEIKKKIETSKLLD